MPTKNDTSTASRRQSWSVRLSTAHARIVERGCAITHGGVASWFVERAFLQHAASSGAIPGIRHAAPDIVCASEAQTVDNIARVQTALATRLEAAAGKRFYARQETLNWLFAYLVARAALTPQPLPETPLTAPLPTPLNLRLLPQHMNILSDMADETKVSRADVIAISLEHAATNLGFDDHQEVGDLDTLGLPRTFKKYPHPDLLPTMKTIEDTILALVCAYRSLAVIPNSPELAMSSARLAGVIPRTKLSLGHAAD